MKHEKTPLWIKVAVFFAIAILPGIDCNAEDGKIEPGKAAVELFFLGKTPNGVKDLLVRVFIPKDSKSRLFAEKSIVDGRVTYLPAKPTEAEKMKNEGGE